MGSNLKSQISNLKSQISNQLSPSLISWKATIEIASELLENSVKTREPNPLNFDTLTIRPVTIKVNDFGESNIISDSSKVDTWSAIINAATKGAKENRFFDADDADNAIKITPEEPQINLFCAAIHLLPVSNK